MHIHPLITDSATLADLCARLADADYVCVDTEFMRENSYWPELCLIQIADDKEAAAIDPMAPGIDLGPLLELMVNNDDVLKVFHAGGQDLEIVYNLTGKTPYPLFDTQIAAMALGQGEQVGYSNLVEAYLGIAVDKGARFTDWSRRPLDSRQLDYAIADVTHLSKIFPKMLTRLRKTGRGDWLDEEMERIGNPSNYFNDPDTAWQRVRVSSRKPEVLGRLKALARWRELEAQNKDLPRGRIAKDETIADLAGNPPKKQADLAKVRGLSAAWAGNDIGGRMMTALAEAEPLPASEMPTREERGPSLGKEGALVADLLKLLLKIRARDINVAARLLARSDELEALAAGQREGLGILRGWRYEEFGRDALALVEGRMAFSVGGGKLKMTLTEAAE
ncbi:ribonuclease D [Sphingomonas sp. 3-13AW]|jgi:ribonuclease D|uniref:ribonuclease D n=1 Tax=Sphingomonas sp. 3-13AW TaxID=3050450 RepID=UPI003BB724BA